MRARSLLTILAIVALVSASGATGCASQDTGSTPGTDAPASEESTPGSQASGYVTVDVESAHEALTSSADAQLVDVREPAEWAETGVPEGAVLIPLGELESRAAESLADGPVYVICRSGNRSRTGSDILVGLGFAEVYNVDGGVTAWVDAGLPVEPYQP